METLIYIIGILVILGIIITILAYIGLKQKRQEAQWIEEYNKEAMEVFKKAQEAKKKKRQSTPKFPTIKK